MWETNRGCPFACTFCDWGRRSPARSISSTGSGCGPSSNGSPGSAARWCSAATPISASCRATSRSRADAIETKQRYGLPRTLAVQNTKNATERAYTVQKMLADAGMNAGVTISLQSTDARTLKAVKRDNISLESFQELQRRYTRDRIETYTDVILGAARRKPSIRSPTASRSDRATDSTTASSSTTARCCRTPR